ncbi:hypothetical protein BKA69DRAFT_1088331, partial [Paraphysoderma sedebokerense]
MMKISKLSLGQEEIGSLRETIEGIRSEYESIANNHLMLSQKIKKEIETPLAEFLSLQREIKINHITASEKNLKAKSLQKQSVLAAKKRYELKCSEVNNLIAAKSVASGKELDKLSSKLEKVQAGMNSADQDYQRAVAQLKKAAETWEIDWRESLKMFEYLEFKRMEQLQKSLLNLQSLLQHTCQSDSYSNDQILNLLNVINVREDLELFVKQNATGDVIHEPMEYKNFYAPASTTPKTRLAITPPDLSSASLPAVELIDQSNPENENPSGSHSPNDAGKNMYINTSPAQYQGSNEQRPSETMPGSLPISMRDASVINLISSTGEGYGYDYNDGPVNGSGEIGLKSTKFEPESDAPDAQSVLSPPPNYDAVTPFPPQQLSNKPPLTAGQTANSTPESRSEPSQSTPHISQLSTDDDGQSASGTDTPPKLKNRRSSSLTKIHSSMMRAIHNIVEGMHSTTAEMEQHASDNPSTKSFKNEAKSKKDKKGKEHEKEDLKEKLKSMHISTNEDFKPNESRQDLPTDVVERGRPVDEVGGDASRSKSKSRSASPTGKSTRSNHSNKSSESFKASIQHPAALVQPQPSRTSSHIQSMSSISFQPPHQPAEYVQAPQTQQQSQQAQYKLRLLSASPIQSNSIQSVHPTVIDTVYRPPSNSPPVTSMLPPSAPGSASSEVSTGKSNPNFNRVNESGTDRPKSNVSVSGVGLSRQTSRALRIPVRNSLEGYANGNGLESENERTGQSQNKNRISTTSGGDSRPSSSISQFSDPASGHRALSQSQSQAVSNIYRPGPSHIASAGIQQASADPSVMSTNKSMKINQSYPQSSSPYSNQDPRPQHQQQQKQPTSMSQSSPNMTNRQPATVAQSYSVYQPQMIPSSNPTQIPAQQQMQQGQPQQSVQMDGRPGSVPGPMNLYMDPHELIVNPAIQVPVLFYVRALYDYNAQIPEELDLDRGQVLAVLATQEDGWWIAELQIGRQKRRGYIPSNFVEEYIG